MRHKFLSDKMADFVAFIVAVPIALLSIALVFGLPVLISVALLKYVFGW